MDFARAKYINEGMKTLQNRNQVYGKGVKSIDITPMEILEIYNKQKGLCYWSGNRLESMYNDISWHPLAISADRLNNNEGYHPDNVVLTQRVWNLGRACFAGDFRNVMVMIKNSFREDSKGIVTLNDFI